MNRSNYLTRVIRAGLVLAALLPFGCNKRSDNGAGGGSASSDNGKIVKMAFVTNNAKEFWKIAAAGVHKYEKEAKVQVDIKMPANGKTEEQNQILENLVSQGYDAIAISPLSPKDQVGILNSAAAKAKLITFDSDAPLSNRLLYIGTNNFEAGKMLGEQIVKLLPNGGKMAVFVGTLSADNATQRLNGIREIIKGHNIEIVDQREDNTDPNAARRNVEDVLNAHTDLNLCCGLWAYNGPAIADAIDAAGKKGKVLAAVFDEEQGTLDGIKGGTVQVTVVQKPFQWGYLASKWMHDLATDPTKATAALPPDKKIDTGVEVINKDNVADFQKRLAEMKK